MFNKDHNKNLPNIPMNIERNSYKENISGIYLTIVSNIIKKIAIYLCTSCWKQYRKHYIKYLITPTAVRQYPTFISFQQTETTIYSDTQRTCVNILIRIYSSWCVKRAGVRKTAPVASSLLLWNNTTHETAACFQQLTVFHEMIWI